MYLHDLMQYELDAFREYFNALLLCQDKAYIYSLWYKFVKMHLLVQDFPNHVNCTNDFGFDCI